MSPQDPQNAALVAHIVSQIEQNVNFLASQNYISNGDASAILTKLPNSSSNQNIGSRNIPPPAIPSSTSAQPPTTLFRALWSYNENGQDPNDLTFAAGDTIEIVEQTNADWWTGRVNGKQGIFPSTYVEKFSPPGNSGAPAKKPYKPFGAAYQGMDAPPSSDQGVNSIGLQEEAKKDRFGKYKSTMAQSAAGGVGFGAGAAIGGGLVRAIF